jgi:hypothetical protein
MTNIVDYIGRLHTIVLHLPIGIFVLAFILQYLTPKKFTIHEQLLSVVFIMGWITAVLSWVLGWMLSLSGDYGPNAIALHKWSALFFVIVSGALMFYYLRRKTQFWMKALYHVLFGLTMLSMVMAGHFGGELTHGEGFLTTEVNDRSTTDFSGKNAQREMSSNSNRGKALQDSGVNKMAALNLPSIKPADSASIEALKKKGFLIRPVSMQTGFIEVSSINISSLNDEMIVSLKPIVNNILWIRLSGEQVTDKGLSVLAEMKNIRRIDIRNTKASDLLLASLKSLAQLEYLNLVGTAITDTGIKDLTTLKSIKNIYCWNTNVTVSGIESFQKSRPDVKIVLGPAQ